VLWIGGIQYHATVLLPSAPAVVLVERAKLLEGVFKRFLRLVWTSILLLVFSGLYKITRVLDSFDQLFTTRYGNVLLIKLLLVLSMVTVAAVFTFVYRPKLFSLLAAVKRIPGDQPASPSPELLDLQKKMTRLVRINLTLGMVILLAVVVLTYVRGR